MTNAAIYVRVDQNDSPHRLTEQFEACRNYATEKGYKIVGELNDIQTGDQSDRAGLGTLREVIQRDGASVVLVTSRDRLASNPDAQRRIEQELTALGATIEEVKA